MLFMLLKELLRKSQEAYFTFIIVRIIIIFIIINIFGFIVIVIVFIIIIFFFNLLPHTCNIYNTFTYINYNSKTTNYSTYSTPFTYTLLQYLSNAYLHITQKLHYGQYSSKTIVQAHL